IGSYPIPDMEFMFFQMMFAMITAGIVLGACAERIKYTAIVWFLAIWSVLVYAPMAHMVWGGGFLAEGLPFDMTTIDFAGGTVVHICAGATGLALAAYLGKRSDKVSKRSHSIPMAFIGCFLLWFGWMGFNGGSGLAADGVAINAIVVSQISAACALASWAVVQYLHVGRVGGLGLIAGAIAGLVAITPAAGTVGPLDAIIIGLVGGVVCYFGVIFMREKSGLDDALDVMGVHGIGGIWGAIATGLFSSAASGGLIYSGDWHLIAGQFVAIVFTLVFCFIVSYVIIFVIGKLMKGVRISENEEAMGQDIVEHGEPAYVM
ncbi:MAG: ammonium transporter, partial [Candidatus Methanomethylophilaceae archaeon]